MLEAILDYGPEVEMKSKIIEGTSPDGLYLKAMVAIFEADEWERRSLVGMECGISVGLLDQEGVRKDNFWILDLSKPCPGGMFKMGRTPFEAKWAMERLPVTF